MQRRRQCSGGGRRRRAAAGDGRQPAWICPESARIEGYPGDCKLLCLSARSLGPSVGVHTVVVVVCDDYERKRLRGRKEGREGRDGERGEREPKKAAAAAAVAEAAATLTKLTAEGHALRG